MASICPGTDLAPEQELQSHRSSNPSVNAIDQDEEIMSRQHCVEIKHNNYVYTTEIRANHPMIAEVLKGHFTLKALIEETRVPLIYRQQFWRTLTFHPDENNHHFKANVDNSGISFGVKS